PEEYLPTYNSNTIELNFHRIPDLSERFVLFNDDMFLLKNVSAEDFFSGGLPRDEFSMNPVLPMGEKFRIAHTNVNNTGVINTHFSKSECFKKNFGKYVNMSYGSDLVRTLLLMPWGCFLGFKNSHLPVSHLKSTFEKVWAEEGEALDRTCRNRFRGYDDLNHWLMRYWNLCEGNFVPRSSSFGRYFNLGDDNRAVMEYIIRQKGSMICINDMSEDIDFERAKKEMKWAFRKILPEKSSFER
ncbi:MAG: stealth conserved region 3 domain-containing protein, partial [Lachnospiraceae bacterium]|nr:stealth conserved region 3 domain-containing protein [Lachnospiraceae bacterium]